MKKNNKANDSQNQHQQGTCASGSLHDMVMGAVERYQCPGCVVGYKTECYEKGKDLACERHVAGTMIMPHVGSIFLGMPKGFNRLGADKELKLHIFETLAGGWNFDKYNVPVWKHKDKNGNVLVRGFMPRLNLSFLHIFLEDCLKDINCFEITDDDMSQMD